MTEKVASTNTNKNRTFDNNETPTLTVNLVDKKNYYSEGSVSNNKSYPLNIMSLLSSNNNSPISISNLDAEFPNYTNSKYSVKSCKYIRGYSANTNQGIIR